METRPDHYPVTVQLRADNVGKQALCASFSATLKASFGLEYHEFFLAPHALQIRELLPAESTSGEYRFDVKTGAQPLELVLKPVRKSQACSGGKESSSSSWHGADQLTFDLANFEAASPQTRATPTGTPSQGSGMRVFIAEEKGETHLAEAIKLFGERCPLAQVTTAKETADYLVQLTPSSFKQSKNVVIVTNQKGDVIYSGTALSLSNVHEGRLLINTK